MRLAFGAVYSTFANEARSVIVFASKSHGAFFDQLLTHGTYGTGRERAATFGETAVTLETALGLEETVLVDCTDALDYK